MDSGYTRRLTLFNDGAQRAAAARLGPSPQSVVWSLAFVEGSLGLVRGASCVAASAGGAQGGGRNQREGQAVSLEARHVEVPFRWRWCLKRGCSANLGWPVCCY